MTEQTTGKPLARWTVGRVTPNGLEVLKVSVRRFGSIYPEFDRIICYNNLLESQLETLRGWNIRLHRQAKDEAPIPIVDDPWVKTGPPKGSGWKFSPPRLRLASHELWIDNDLIIRERIPLLDRWMTVEEGIIAEDQRAEYDIFSECISEEIPCSGALFGLPPHFDFGRWIKDYGALLGG